MTTNIKRDWEEDLKFIMKGLPVNIDHVINRTRTALTQSRIALLESVVGVVESMEGITIENRDGTKTELLNKQDILTELQEALKELKK